MSWQRKQKTRGKNKNYSLSKKLKKEGRTNEKFELMLHALTLEELIGLKLEISSKFGMDHKLYGLPIWNCIHNIVKDAVLKYALSACSSNREAARFIGIQENDFCTLTKKYKSDNYFKEEDENTSDKGE